MYVLALNDYKHSAAAAGYKPAPPIRQIDCSLSKSSTFPQPPCLLVAILRHLILAETTTVPLRVQAMLNDHSLTCRSNNALRGGT